MYPAAPGDMPGENIRARASAEPGHEDVAQPSILDVSSFLSLKGTRTFGIGLEDSKIRRLERGRGRSGRSAPCGAWPSIMHFMADGASRLTRYVLRPNADDLAHTKVFYVFISLFLE